MKRCAVLAINQKQKGKAWKGAGEMTNKPEKNNLEELKQEVLMAYLNQRKPGTSWVKKREWEKKYQDAKKRLAECIATELK